MVKVALEIPESLATEIAARLPEGETLETAAVKALKLLLRDAIVREEAAQLEQVRQEPRRPPKLPQSWPPQIPPPGE